MNQIHNLSRTLAATLGQKINPYELTQARLSITENEEPLPGISQHLSEFRLIQDFCVAYALEEVSSELLGAHVRLIGLLARLCKRHLNMIKVNPPPASLAARCLEHLLEFSCLLANSIGGKSRSLTESLSELSKTFGLAMRDILERKRLHLRDLDRPLIPEDSSLVLSVSRGLADEINLIEGCISLIEESFASYMRSLSAFGEDPVSPWMTLNRKDVLIPTIRHLEAFSPGHIPETTAKPNHGPKVGDLITGHLQRYTVNLGSAIELLHQRIDFLEQHDAKLFSAQFHAPHLAIENELLIRALSHYLRLHGEPADDIENFAKKLMAYSAEHKALCSAILDSEVIELATGISPSSVSAALRHVKYHDIECPLSVAHKNKIFHVVTMAELLLSELMTAHPENSTPDAEQAKVKRSETQKSEL